MLATTAMGANGGGDEVICVRTNNYDDHLDRFIDDTLLERLPRRTLVMTDRAYDTYAICRQIEGQGAVPNIPSKVTRRWKSCFSPVLYLGGNAVERMFYRLKDYRRIATRYDKLADNFLSAVYIVATVTSWL